MYRKKSCAVVVIVYNGDQLNLCLRSLLSQKLQPDEIILLTSNVTRTNFIITSNFQKELDNKNILTKVVLSNKTDFKNPLRQILINTRNDFIFIVDEYCILQKSWLYKLGNYLKKPKTIFIGTRLESRKRSIWIGSAIRITLLKKINQDLLTALAKIDNRSHAYCIIKPTIKYLVPKKFLGRKIRYPFSYLISSVKAKDSFWTVLVLDPIALRIIWVLANFTRITPNAISLLSTLFGVFSAYFFLIPTPLSYMTGGLSLMICHLLDCVDGKLARTLKMESNIGAFMDIVRDRIIILINVLALSISNFSVSQSINVFLLGVTLIFVNTYARLFSFYYSSIRSKIKSKLGYTPLRIINNEVDVNLEIMKPPALSPQNFIESLSSLRKFLHRRRIKLIPYMYEIEMLSLSFGAIFDQVEAALIISVILCFTIFAAENLIRVVKIIRYEKHFI